MSYLVNLFAYQREVLKSLKENDFPFQYLDKGRYSPIQSQKFPGFTIHYRVLKTDDGLKVIFKNYDRPVSEHGPVIKGNTLYIFDNELCKTIKVDVEDYLTFFKKELSRFSRDNEVIDFNLSREQKELLCSGHDIKLNVYSKSNLSGKTAKARTGSKLFSTDLTFFKGRTEFLISKCNENKGLHQKLSKDRETQY